MGPRFVFVAADILLALGSFIIYIRPSMFFILIHKTSLILIVAWMYVCLVFFQSAVCYCYIPARILDW